MEVIRYGRNFGRKLLNGFGGGVLIGQLRHPIWKIVVVFLFFFLLIGVANQVTEYWSQNSSFCRAKDGNYYQVRNLGDKKRAADLLARMNKRIKIFLRYLRKKHYNNRTVLRLCRNYNEHQVCEADGVGRHTSYSINKGEKIVFCLRHRHEDRQEHLTDINTMMFVAIHELAHLMSHSVGHTNEFWDNMKFLLKEALECPRKIYRYVPYHQTPVEYCGIVISDTPYKPS